MTAVGSSSKEAVRPWFDSALPQSVAEAILRESRIVPQRFGTLRLLDFGCGNGRYMESFAGVLSRDNMAGVEVDPEAVEIAREKGFNVLSLDPERAELPFADESFDFVFSSNVIEHIPRPLYLRYMEEVARVLAPGGVFFVGAPNYPFKRAYDMVTALKTPQLREYYLHDDPTHINKQSVLTVERQLARYFDHVRLRATELPFQRFLFPLRHRFFLRHLRVIGNKFVGTCLKRPTR